MILLRPGGRPPQDTGTHRRLLYKVLAARSFSVTSATRARIERETDTTRLEAWLETAVTARTVRDVFRRR